MIVANNSRDASHGYIKFKHLVILIEKDDIYEDW